MSDEFIRQMARHSDYGSEEEVWTVFRDRFMLKGPHERIADMRLTDQWLEAQDRPTKEAASILTRVRELNGIHAALRRAGR
jgi:hypothetical protein